MSSDDINYKNNPLHGLGLKALVEEIVNHYGFDILYAYLQLNCFKTNPSIDSSVKFLKKTEWAREKVEAFYLYQYKNLPKAPAREFSIAPRDRIIPDDQSSGQPALLTLEDATRLNAIRADKAAKYNHAGNHKRHNNKPRRFDSIVKSHNISGNTNSPTKTSTNFDPWAKAKNKIDNENE
jgi:uncharacterized protein (DUF2132 family)